jgi:DNA-binding transcriptional ArsR family regulator
MSATNELDLAFRALGDPTRRQMLRILAGGEQGVVELASNFDLSQPGVTKHLNVLENAGLISRERRGRFRVCRLEPEALERTGGWLEDLGRYWRSRFAAIDEILEKEKEQK